MTIKSKDEIYKKNKIVINKTKTYTGKKIQNFWSNDVRKHYLLVPYFEIKSHY